MAALILAPSIDRTVRDVALDTHPIYGARPLLRGRFHQAAALVSVPVGTQLIAAVDRPGAGVPVLLFAVTCTLMYTASASYHRLAQSIAARFWMRRLDHSMIFLHIAGATTPIALLGVGGAVGLVLVATSWTGAVIGAALKMTRLSADNDPCSWIFPVLGLLPLLAVPGVAGEAGWGCAGLLVASMLTYLAGAVCFSRKSPDPMPTIFGYHEVWHVFTLVAGAFQLAVIADLATL